MVEDDAHSSPTIAHVPAADALQATSQRALLVMSSSGVLTLPLPHAGDVAIGRATECAVRIDDAKASRRHAILHVDDDCTIEDLGSTNGTLLEGRRLPGGQRVPLRAGAMVSIGHTVLVLQNVSEQAPPVRVWSERAFNERVDEARARASGDGGAFALLRVELEPWADLDAIDSTSGNSKAAATSARIERLEAVFRGALRPTDVVGSTAPSVYEILLPSSAAAEAQAIAAQLQRDLHEAGFPHAMRVASYPNDGETRESLEAHAEALREEEEAPPKGVAEGSSFEREVAPLVDKVAGSDINVLILGETGVGKEVLARTIHARSHRAAKPLVSINCAALSESLLESELFGHEKGAFTGAVQAKPGLIESGDGGTVFLDEIGEMPLPLQAKLLRVLEQREVQRVGSLRPKPVDVRFVAATNRDLEAEIAAGRFRQDLYFRLNGIAITIPPLRERVDEIEPLAREFVAQACARAKRSKVPRLAPAVLDLLRRYPWPGNIRELRNVMERAVLLASGDAIALDGFPASMLAGGRRLAPPSSRETEVTGRYSSPQPQLPEGDERARVIAALEMSRGNQTLAAKILGVSRRTLVSRLTEYKLPRPRKRAEDEGDDEG